jgi:D-arginine dehydrogenase
MIPRVAIIGAGIAGAGLAWFLGDRARVTLLEGESQPGYHTTGRSAAFYAETYGGPAIQPLTTASREFFEAPPAGFAAVPLLGPRGGLHIADAAGQGALAELEAEFAGTGVRIERVSGGDIAPQLTGDWAGLALWEPDCRDIDVAALHQGFLSGAKRSGARLLTDAMVRALSRQAGAWRIDTAAGVVEADILVNAAGAWGDGIAAMAGVAPAGLQPLRRTVVVADVEPAADPALPLVVAADGSFYFKPDAGRLWVSPHDETPDVPGDVQPEELDIALALDRLERATSYRIRRVDRAWAGLRTFAPDRLPVLGYAAGAPDFVWCVGQGGFGIQTAPAAGRLLAEHVLGGDAERLLPGFSRYLPRASR